MRPDDARSPVWGGATLALIAGLAFGAISAILGWGDFVGYALKAGTVVFVLMAVLSLPGAIMNIARRTPLAGRAAGETFWEVLISAVLIYFAFVRG